MKQPKLAIVTQSYRNDINECMLLCESIDRFVPNEVEHYIFVNDEDYNLFQRYPIFRKRHLHRKSEIMPRTYFRFPFKVLGHQFHLSPLSMPVREWIVQQICKLGVFEIIDKKFDAVMNVDSESIFLKPFDINKLVDNTGKWILYQHDYYFEPNHDEYCKATKKLFKLNDDIVKTASAFRYMSNPVIFVRENISDLLTAINKNSLINWKYTLGNIYRFSENYIYAIYTIYNNSCKNHYLTDKTFFPLIHRSDIICENDLKVAIETSMKQDHTLGILLQKVRRTDETKCLSFETVKNIIHSKF